MQLLNKLVCAYAEGGLALQELFPESYAETAAWLRREVAANGDSLSQREQQLQQAVEQDAHFQSLAAGCQVCLPYLLMQSASYWMQLLRWSCLELPMHTSCCKFWVSHFRAGLCRQNLYRIVASVVCLLLSDSDMRMHAGLQLACLEVDVSNPSQRHAQHDSLPSEQGTSLIAQHPHNRHTV